MGKDLPRMSKISVPYDWGKICPSNSLVRRDRVASRVLFDYNNSNNEYGGTNKSEHKRRSPQELKENIGNRLPSINYSRQKMPKLKESTV